MLTIRGSGSNDLAELLMHCRPVWAAFVAVRSSRRPRDHRGRHASHSVAPQYFDIRNVSSYAARMRVRKSYRQFGVGVLSRVFTYNDEHACWPTPLAGGSIPAMLRGLSPLCHRPHAGADQLDRMRSGGC